MENEIHLEYNTVEDIRHYCEALAENLKKDRSLLTVQDKIYKIGTNLRNELLRVLPIKNEEISVTRDRLWCKALLGSLSANGFDTVMMEEILGRFNELARSSIH